MIPSTLTAQTVSQFSSLGLNIGMAPGQWRSAGETCSSGSISCICFGMFKLLVS